MKRVWMLAALMLVAAIVAAPAWAAPNKWVRGPVTAMTADTISVTVKGAVSTFKVEPTTQLIARGAGTAAREAAQTGKPGPKLSDFVKVGQFVEVRYTETGGVMVATEVRPIAPGDESASVESAPSGGTSAAGVVVTVTTSSVVISTDGKDVTFAVTPKTTVLGPGMSTKTRELAAAGKPATINEFIGPKDQVVVYYAEGGATPQASSIRVVQKALK